MKRKLDVLYEHYQYLANQYARQVFSYGQLSYEFEDVLQEFKIKIFSAIKAYGKVWSAYRRGERPRPVHMRYYLKTACVNKKNDFVKYINREGYKVRIDNDDFNIDFGSSAFVKFEPEEDKYIVNGIDLLENMQGREREVVAMYFRGYKKSELNKVYFSTEEEKAKRKQIKEEDDEPFDAMDIVNLQLDYLMREHGDELFSNSKVYQIQRQD